MKNVNGNSVPFRVAMAGMFSAQALVLAFFESFLPLSFLPQGIKPGLSNIIVMYMLETAGPVPAIFIAIIKAGFSGLTRGVISFILSLSGGLASIAVMAVLRRMKSLKAGATGISIAGAVIHNMMQLLIISFITNADIFVAYSPVLIVSGIVMGTVTGIILKLITPMLKKYAYAK